MKSFFLKTASLSALIMVTCMMVNGQANSNYSAIRNANIQIKGSLHNEPLAWASETVAITVNKQTGEFKASILVDDLYFATPNEKFKGASEENKGKYLTLSGTIPVDDVLANTNNAIDRKVEMTANFNDIDYLTPFTFTILKMPGGFSVMANGTISIGALQIENLSDLDDELVIILSFTGY